jgi:hypothetical protein
VAFLTKKESINMDKEYKKWLTDIKQAFVYVWTNKETGRQYIGSHAHYSREDEYVSSSTNPEFWEDYNKGLLEREIIYCSCMRGVRFFERNLLSSRRKDWGKSLYNLTGYVGKNFTCARRYYVYNHKEVIYVDRVTKFEKEHNLIKISRNAGNKWPLKLSNRPIGEDYFLVSYADDIDNPETLKDDFIKHLREIEPKVIKNHVVDRRNKLWETLVIYKESLGESVDKGKITEAGVHDPNQYIRMKERKLL